jgi:hypothetical protein
MDLNKYFKQDQKVLLRHLGEGEAKGRVAALTAYVISFSGKCLRLRLPYGNTKGEGYPFTPAMAFEILTDALTMGIRVTGIFIKTENRDELQIELNNDIQAFQRRTHGRKDVMIGMRYTKGQGTLRTFHDQWLKNVDILDKTDREKLPTFPNCNANLSMGGIRFMMKKPIAVADLCILLLDLGDNSKPLCTLAEVVWQSPLDEPQHHDVGMQFLHILERDQKRIESYLKKV